MQLYGWRGHVPWSSLCWHSNANKGIVIFHTLHRYSHTDKTAQHLLRAQQSLRTHRWSGTGCEGCLGQAHTRFQTIASLGWPVNSWWENSQVNIFEVHTRFSSCFEYRLLYSITSMGNKSKFPGIVCWPARGWAFFTRWSVPGFICSEDNNKRSFHVTSAQPQGSTEPTMTTAHRNRMWASGYFDSIWWDTESLGSTLYQN